MSVTVHGRNEHGLNTRQIESCKRAWEVLCGDDPVELDTSRAHLHSTETKWDELEKKVHLGANVIPGNGCEANCRLSMLACLAHELAHARRSRLSIQRGFDKASRLVDEAETSLSASEEVILSENDRHDLIEDAHVRIVERLEMFTKGNVDD